MPNLTISFTPASPAPALGYRVKYWNTSTPGNIITVSPNPTTSPVNISGVAAGCYAGTVESACSGGVFSGTVSFNACSGAAFCVAVSSTTGSEASQDCSGVNDTFTVYTFTLKDTNGNTVNAPSNVTVTFNGWTNYPGGATAYNGTAVILSGNSTATATVYTSQALNGAPGCPCPCQTTVSIDEQSFAATIASPNTVTICQPAQQTASFTITNMTSNTVSLTDFTPAWFTIDTGTPSNLTAGNSASGIHGGYNGSWGITVGSSNNACLVLRRNEGEIVASIAITGPGSYTFPGISIASTDEVVLEITNSCP